MKYLELPSKSKVGFHLSFYFFFFSSHMESDAAATTATHNQPSIWNEQILLNCFIFLLFCCCCCCCLSHSMFIRLCQYVHLTNKMFSVVVIFSFHSFLGIEFPYPYEHTYDANNGDGRCFSYFLSIYLFHILFSDFHRIESSHKFHWFFFILSPHPHTHTHIPHTKKTFHHSNCLWIYLFDWSQVVFATYIVTKPYFSTFLFSCKVICAVILV